MGLQSSKLISVQLPVCLHIAYYNESMQQLRAKGTTVSDEFKMQTENKKQGDSMPASNTEKMASII